MVLTARGPRASSDPGELRAPRNHRHPPRARRTPPATAVAAVLVALVIGALLNGPGLVRAATGLPVGPVREAAIAVAGGTARTGAALGLDRPQQWLTAARDGELGANIGIASSSAGAVAPDDDQPDSGGDNTGVATEPEDSAGQGAGPVVTGRADGHDRVHRPITADEPLAVLLAGDSLIGAIADGYGRRTVDNDLATWTKDVRISSGLARPDILDWHLHLQQLLDAHDPDVVVLLLGGNDDQSLASGPDGVIHYGQPGWAAEYEARAARLQEIAAGAGREVVWLEVPAMRPARLEQARQRMNAAARRAAAGTGVLVIDTDALIAPQGYAGRLEGVQVRADDGVHLTHPGGDLVAEVIDRVLAERYGLPTE